MRRASISMLDLRCFKRACLLVDHHRFDGVNSGCEVCLSKAFAAAPPKSVRFHRRMAYSRTYVCNFFNIGSPFKGKVFVGSWVALCNHWRLKFSMFNFSCTPSHKNQSKSQLLNFQNCQVFLGLGSSDPRGTFLWLNTDLTGKKDCTKSDFDTGRHRKWLGSSWKFFFLTYFF